MEEKDLIKKLEEVSLPEIEIPSHKRKLKSILMGKYFKERRKWEIFDILKKTIPAGAVVILLIGLIFTNLILPRYNLTEAKEIALQNPQIKEWIESGATIKDAKIIRNQVYVLIQPPEKIKETPAILEKETLAIPKTVEIQKEEFNGALAEINLKEKKVAKIEKLTPQVLPLTEIEKEKIKEIAKKNPEIEKVIPKEAEILNIKRFPPQLKLMKEGDSVQVLPEPGTENKAAIIYQFGKRQWEGKINVSAEIVEEVKYLGEIKE